MKIIIETSRLYLREFIPEDGYHFFHMNNDPEVVKYTGNEPFESMESAMGFIADYAEYKHHGFGRWAVCCRETDTFFGWCGLKYKSEYDAVDLGFRFYRKYWNRGYATESGRACLKYGFEVLGLKRIIGRAYTENHASIQVLQKCGMKFVKTYEYDNREAKLYEQSHVGN